MRAWNLDIVSNSRSLQVVSVNASSKQAIPGVSSSSMTPVADIYTNNLQRAGITGLLYQIYWYRRDFGFRIGDLYDRQD